MLLCMKINSRFVCLPLNGMARSVCYPGFALENKSIYLLPLERSVGCPS